MLMRWIVGLTLVFVVFVNCNEETQPNPVKEWNENIEWFETTEDAIEAAEKEHKPIMMVVHRTWCHACIALKPKFAASKEIEELSKDFIMLNLHGWEDPWQAEYQTDGTYVPRILFLFSGGEVMKSITNTNHDLSYKFFYPDPEPIVASMTKVLEKYKSTEYAFDDKYEDDKDKEPKPDPDTIPPTKQDETSDKAEKQEDKVEKEDDKQDEPSDKAEPKSGKSEL